MAAAKKRKRRKKQDEEDEELEDSPSFFQSMNPETVRGIAGVALFVLAVLLILSPLRMAGVAGEKAFGGIYLLFGIGYFLLPVMLGAWAISLFKQNYAENIQRPIRIAGALLFFVSSLAMVAVMAPDKAGLLGKSAAAPLLTYLDTVATIVILTGLIMVSFLLLFDSELWVLLFQKIKGLFSKNTDTELDTNAEVSEEEDGAEEAVEADEAEEDADETEEDETSDEESEETALGKLFGSKKKDGKKSGMYEMPSEYTSPPLALLEADRGKANVGDTKARSNLIKRTLQHFKIPVEMDEIVVGPTVTRYSLKPAEGVKLSKILTLQPNLELALAASPIRIEAPIPGRSLVGIEVPNHSKSIVGLASLLSSPEFTEETVPLFVTLGRDIAGSAHYANVGKMPHVLVAGTTGSGKSVMMHSIVASLLYRNGPDRVRFIMVDPKRVELTLYNNIPHLLTPVITDAKKSILALKWATKEMDRRYDILQENKVQDITTYHDEVVAPAHKKAAKQKSKGKDISDFEMPDTMPHIVIVIDELADIMTAYPRELEAVIVRLAQMSRAVGIHLVLSTQRPSVNVITGLIKANIPTRIALKVASLVDSRTILDQSGAEKLLGAGDMLYLSGDMAKPRRIQSPFLTTSEVKKIVAFLIDNNDPELPESINFSDDMNGGNIPLGDLEQDEDRDELYGEVRAFIIDAGKASTSLIQRKFKVGYGRAARIMDQLEADGVISESDGTNKPRHVLVGDDEMTPENPEDEAVDADEEEDVDEEEEAYER